jgi:hypothetical protein
MKTIEYVRVSTDKQLTHTSPKAVYTVRDGIVFLFLKVAGKTQFHGRQDNGGPVTPPWQSLVMLWAKVAMRRWQL